MKAHPLAELFPMTTGGEFEMLAASIKEKGLEEPIVVYDGQVLDGRNRQAACEQANVSPDYVNYEGDDPLGYVILKNLHRRHLSETQRAMVAAQIPGLQRGKPANNSANLRNKDIAQQLNVSSRSVESARSVKNNGTSELISATQQDEIPVSVAAKIAKENPETQRKIVASDDPKTEIKKLKRRDKLQELEAKATELPTREYSVIYADPPWSWDTYSESGKDRTPENHYKLMSAEDIGALEVPASKDAVLFMWTTAPHLETAFKVLSWWGFQYKSNVVWKKDRIGTGYWSRNLHEHLLIATRGNIPAPPMGEQCHSVIEAQVGRHSEKPSEFRDIIDSYYPNLTKLEMFSRVSDADGWDMWGNEVSE